MELAVRMTKFVPQGVSAITVRGDTEVVVVFSLLNSTGSAIALKMAYPSVAAQEENQEPNSVCSCFK